MVQTYTTIWKSSLIFCCKGYRLPAPLIKSLEVDRSSLALVSAFFRRPLLISEREPPSCPRGYSTVGSGQTLDRCQVGLGLIGWVAWGHSFGWRVGTWWWRVGLNWLEAWNLEPQLSYLCRHFWNNSKRFVAPPWVLLNI